MAAPSFVGWNTRVGPTRWCADVEPCAGCPTLDRPAGGAAARYGRGAPARQNTGHKAARVPTSIAGRREARRRHAPIAIRAVSRARGLRVEGYSSTQKMRLAAAALLLAARTDAASLEVFSPEPGSVTSSRDVALGFFATLDDGPGPRGTQNATSLGAACVARAWFERRRRSFGHVRRAAENSTGVGPDARSSAAQASTPRTARSAWRWTAST